MMPFQQKNKDHLNLICKLNNSICDLNFYAYRFLTWNKFISTPKTGIEDAIKLQQHEHTSKRWPYQLFYIIEQHNKILNSTPETANELFYQTWRFVHDFDKLFQK